MANSNQTKHNSLVTNVINNKHKEFKAKWMVSKRNKSKHNLITYINKGSQIELSTLIEVWKLLNMSTSKDRKSTNTI
jgi:poly(3-hydroxyalkanoate) synthetase